MKVAIIGSRGLNLDISPYIPPETTTIISGGAKGIDRLAAQYARRNGIPLIEFLPDYEAHGHAAPFVRNRQIAESADMVIAIWDGCSKGTIYTLKYASKIGKRVKIYEITE